MTFVIFSTPFFSPSAQMPKDTTTVTSIQNVIVPGWDSIPENWRDLS